MPQIKSHHILYRDRAYDIEYFYRAGTKETILFVHGLGGAKENYWEACKSDALDGHTLIAFDNPGTGNSTYYDEVPLNVDDLVAITGLFIKQLKIANYILVGTSMGGLTTLLHLKRNANHQVKGYVNIEGNLMPEDCMFSSKVVMHDYAPFAMEIFPATIVEMRSNGNTGYHIIANNLALNTNIKAYYQYSFQTVEYSASGELLKQYMSMNTPRIFIYGNENSALSYLPQLINSGLETRAISNSNHFVFYDNPKEMYEVIGEFIDRLEVASFNVVGKDATAI